MHSEEQAQRVPVAYLSVHRLFSGGIHLVFGACPSGGDEGVRQRDGFAFRIAFVCVLFAPYGLGARFYLFGTSCRREPGVYARTGDGAAGCRIVVFNRGDAGSGEVFCFCFAEERVKYDTL